MLEAIDTMPLSLHRATRILSLLLRSVSRVLVEVCQMNFAEERTFFNLVAADCSGCSVASFLNIIHQTNQSKIIVEVQGELCFGVMI